MCKVTVNDCLPLLKFVPDCFVTKKMLKDLDNTVFFNGDIVFVNEDSDNPTLYSDDMGLVNVNLNVSLDDVLAIMILKLLFMLDLRLGVIDISKVRHIKKR